MVAIRYLFLLTSICLFSTAIYSQQTKTRIGTFDSRCIAIAYGRTAEFRNNISELRNELAKAKQDGDSIRIKELEELGPTKQVLMHQQGFSTGSIRNILEKLTEKIPAIAEENNVIMIVSKWEVVHADESIDLVDITDNLVELFSPDEKTKEIIENIKTMEPVPLEKISINPMH
jgi:Skp family chaperone for outer membrane proteins